MNEIIKSNNKFVQTTKRLSNCNFLANHNSICGFVRPSFRRSVGPSVRRSDGLSVSLCRFFFDSGKAKKKLDNEFQSSMKVSCKRALNHAHLHAYTCAHSRIHARVATIGHVPALFILWVLFVSIKLYY